MPCGIYLLRQSLTLFISVAVVVAFFICWAPFHTQRLMVIYLKKEHWTPALKTVFSVLYYISGILYYVSSVINPILYNIMSLKFRQAFKQTIFRPCRRRRNNNHSHHVATYKFQLRPPTDSNTSALLKAEKQNKPNPPIFTFNGIPRNLSLQKFCRPLPSTSSNSASAGSHARILPNGDLHVQDPFDHIELDPMIVECKSLSYGENRSPDNDQNWRPYHSYA